MVAWGILRLGSSLSGARWTVLTGVCLGKGLGKKMGLTFTQHNLCIRHGAGACLPTHLGGKGELSSHLTAEEAEPQRG